MKHHYAYRITNTQMNKHYYGVRSSKVEPKLDLGIKYFSSSTDKNFIKEQKENKDIFKYKIIKLFETREEAINMEIKLHNKFDVGLNESFYNKSKQTSAGFDTSGVSPWNVGLTKENNECIKNIALKKIGSERTVEQKLTMSNSAKGRIPWNKGKQLTDEQKQKRKDNYENIFTDEYKMKLKHAKIGYRPHNADKGYWVTPYGKFLSLTLAFENELIKELGISKSTIYSRCKSNLEKYNEWSYEVLEEDIGKEL